MGYNVSTGGIDFHIPDDKLADVTTALKDLNKRDDLKTGGSYGPREDGTYGQREVWFAWMPADYDQTAVDAQEIFELLGFSTEQVEVDEKGPGLRLLSYDSKTGAEDHFLAAAAPFVTPGSFIEWEGEDGARWRDEFDGTTVNNLTGRTIYE
jgi:hypothetical protein